MDIDYLLLLQNLREATNNVLTPFMEMISLFAVTYLIIVPAFVYWCIDKRSGLYTIASYHASVSVNAVVKLTCCVYRPWIRDSRVLPAGDAITTATGYSFPSGHTMTATPIYGGLAVSAWKKLRWISVLCIICLVLTAFSRNYLGVHTPQDVLVGLAIGTAVLFGMSALFKFLTAHPEKENLILGIGAAFCIAALVYITLKPYPMDYVNDKLLVDPERMKKDGYGDIGMLLALCGARFIEKTWIKYKPTVTKENLVKGLAGAVLTFFLIETMGQPMTALFGVHWGALAKSFVIVMFIIAIWPAIMKATDKKSAAPERSGETTILKNEEEQ